MENKSSFIRKEIWPLLILAAGLAVAVCAYPVLPERVPIHWGLNGQANGYGSRFFGSYGVAFMNIGLYILFLVLPVIDPRRANYAGFKDTYKFIRYLIHIFILGMQVMGIITALGYPVNIGLLVKLFIALLFLLMGNVMGRFKHNYFVGIKTPWTLASEEVWTKTHRMAAPIWVAGGIVSIANAFIGGRAGSVILIGVLIVMVFVPCVYSYIEYGKLGKR